MAGRASCIVLVAALALMAQGAQARPPLVRLPIVGCPSDGQGGLETPPPHGRTEAVRVDPRLAPRLAYYMSRYGQNIGPRGWHCMALEGSNGDQLFIAKAPISGEDLLAGSMVLRGPAIQLAHMFGDTSGRFAVAQSVARYFPKHRAFVDAVIAEKLMPVSYFPSGPYPGDRFLRRTANRVEVETPPHVKGLGTSGRLVPDDLSVVSIVVFTDPPGVATVLIKLPPDQRDLLPAIVPRL